MAKNSILSLERLQKIPKQVRLIEDPDAYLLEKASDAYNEKHSKIWEEVAVGGGISRHHLKLIYDVVLRKGLQKEGRVLDLGCGTGPIALELAGNMDEGGEVHGMDISEHQLQKARDKAKELGFDNMTFVRATSTDGIPYPDRHFDLVVTHIAFQIMPYKEKVLREIFRVLDSGGMLALVCNSESEWSHVVNAPEAWCCIFDYAEKNPEKTDGKIRYPLGVFPTISKMDTWLNDIGYSEIDICEHNPFHYAAPMMNRAYWSIWIDDDILDGVTEYARMMAEKNMTRVGLMEPRLHVFARRP